MWGNSPNSFHFCFPKLYPFVSLFVCKLRHYHIASILTFESLYIPIFSSLFSIWIFLIFLLFRLVPYCLIIFHVFFFFYYVMFLFLLLKKKGNKVLHCSMVHRFKLYYVFFFNLIFLMKKLYYVDKTKFRNLIILLLIASSLRCNCSQLYRILFFWLWFFSLACVYIKHVDERVIIYI